MTDGTAPARAPLADWLALIRFSHTVFALPFALLALFVATDGRPPLRVLVLCVLAMVAARTAAMAYNRWLDRAIDARNPRTRNREIPRGAIAPRQALALALIAGAGFVVVAAWLAPICGWLALPTLALLFGYSHAKRFTASCHLWLGAALGLAPAAAWLAAHGAIEPTLVAALVLGLGVMLWVAGFDILYACQDADFDRREGLHSWPARLGIPNALRLARALHAAAALGFLAFGFVAALGWIWFVGVLLASGLLALQHRIVKADDLSRVNLAFFTLNGVVGLWMLAVGLLDLWLL
ncbi:MAG: UbiA family prenyltransferase [Planctomycetes bacterium]|nr:UbiA family prenyltransferase [Planctomycetota bacterium]